MQYVLTAEEMFELMQIRSPNANQNKHENEGKKNEPSITLFFSDNQVRFCNGNAISQCNSMIGRAM